MQGLVAHRARLSSTRTPSGFVLNPSQIYLFVRFIKSVMSHNEASPVTTSVKISTRPLLTSPLVPPPVIGGALGCGPFDSPVPLVSLDSLLSRATHNLAMAGSEVGSMPGSVSIVSAALPSSHQDQGSQSGRARRWL